MEMSLKAQLQLPAVGGGEPFCWHANNVGTTGDILLIGKHSDVWNLESCLIVSLWVRIKVMSQALKNKEISIVLVKAEKVMNLKQNKKSTLDSANHWLRKMASAPSSSYYFLSHISSSPGAIRRVQRPFLFRWQSSLEWQIGWHFLFLPPPAALPSLLPPAPHLPPILFS